MSTFKLVDLLNDAVNITFNVDGGLNYRGEYDNGTEYVLGDVVSYNGSSYIAFQTTTGNLPTDTGFWYLMAAQGDTGVTGATGVTGDTGVTGSQGNQGDTGNAGADGDTGVAGDQGDTGTNGATGIQGVDGDTGTQGDTGVAGSAGVQGDTGVSGDTGIQGDAGVTGAKGDTGTHGNTGVTGATGIGDTGIQGDTGIGNTGVTGATGTVGATGTAGTKGDTGVKGDAGDQGDTGTAGSQGVAGDTGTTGATGAKGDTGVDLTTHASKALDDLASVAINTSLISDTDSTDDLGSSAKYWANTYTDILYLGGSQLTPYFPTNEPMERPSETVITTFQTGHGFTLTTGGGAIADDTSVYCKGSQSLKITTKGDGTQIRVTKASISPTLNISGKMIKVLLKTDDPTNYLSTTSQVLIGFSSDNFSSHYFYYSATYVVAHEYGGDNWIEIGFSPSNMSTTGTPDLTAINAIRIYAKDNPVGVVNLWLQSISMFSPPSQGIVSLTFDDGPVSQYTEAAKKMSEYGFAGTAYVIPAQIDTAGYMTLAQLKNLQDIHGWDISSHYATNFTTLTAPQLETAIKSVKSYLSLNGFTKGMDHLAYPQGDYNQTVMPIVKKYFASGRMSSVGLHETLPVTDCYRIKTFPVKNTTTTAEVAAQVTAAITKKDWLVLVFHRVLETTSASEDCTITDFGTIIDDIATQGIAVKPVSEVINRWTPKADHTKLDNIGTNTHAQIDTFITNTVKNTGAEITAGTDDVKYSTAKSITDAGLLVNSTTRPENHGLVGWTYDPSCGTSSYLLTTKGLSYGARIYIPKATTISNILICTSGTAGASLTNAWIALYQNGELLAQSASQITNWQASSGLKTVAITPQNVTAGNVDIIFWCQDWGTAPTFVRAAGSALVNAGLSGATLRYFTADANLTDTAPSTLGTKSALSISFWLAIS